MTLNWMKSYSTLETEFRSVFQIKSELMVSICRRFWEQCGRTGVGGSCFFFGEKDNWAVFAYSVNEWNIDNVLMCSVELIKTAVWNIRPKKGRAESKAGESYSPFSFISVLLFHTLILLSQESGFWDACAENVPLHFYYNWIFPKVDPCGKFLT